MWGKNQKKLFVPNNFKLAETHALISGFKTICTWNTIRGLQECREACGGLGYSHYALIGQLIRNHDVNQTWEGDNNVLLQQAAKFLLDCLRKKIKGKLPKTKSCEWIETNPVDGET